MQGFERKGEWNEFPGPPTWKYRGAPPRSQEGKTGSVIDKFNDY
jgi:hypothetical protein